MILPVTPGVLGFLVLAAFCAGLVDAIGGGGGLIALPALIAAGLPPSFALATNKGQSVFGTSAATFSYFRAGVIDRKRAPIAFVCAILGGLGGARLQLSLRPDALRPIIAVLLIIAALIILLRRPPKTAHVMPRHPMVLLSIVTFVLGFYDGFFGPGVGAMLIVLFTLIFGDTMLRASANAKVANVASNLAAIVVFALRGNVLWLVSLPMAAGNAAGSMLGARLAVKRGDRFVRVVVLVAVACAIAKLVHDSYK